MLTAAMQDETKLRRRLRAWTLVFIVGLVASGATAMPIQSQFEMAQRWLGADFRGGGWVPEFVASWLVRVHEGVELVTRDAPFVWYGTDWLAFGHFAIALAFIGALRDPVRNRWLYDFGLLACAAVIPFALACGAVREIPFWWRLIDSSFGVIGALPLLACRKWARELDPTAR
jgi:asparagine N-glycosylation enzyme membrane subunit Stt3